MEEPSQATADCQNNDLILPDGWEAVLVENNRWFYLHETQKTCCWLPPAQSWQSRRGLPYGWELARSNDGRRYYINHLTKETVRFLRSSSDTTFATSIPPRTREVVISRHSDIGFGFVAGSEKPVLIRSVAEDGPSAGKLHANDQILKINGEDVRDLPQADVILRIKQYTHELCLEVIANDDVQDVKNLGQRKSSIMSRTTRERRRSNPVSVRFAEAPVLVQYVGSPPTLPLRRSSLPLIPNVLKIFLENGQTRSFLYNPGTTVKDLFSSLGEKIGLKKLDRFSLVLQATQSLNDSYVQGNERASQIYLKRNCSSSTWLCKLLLVFAPKDIHFLLREDPVAFDYFYKQMCSQVVEGRFGWELKYETAIKLAALHIQQYALEEKVGKGGKISVKAIEKEVGSLDIFVPAAIINTMQKKDLHRVLSQQIKQTRNLCPPGQKYIFPLQAKLQYLKICSEMKTYGGKQFNAVVVDPTEDPKFFPDQKLASVIFIGPNVGLSQVTNPRSFSMHRIAEFSQIIGLVVTPHTEGKQNLKLFLTDGKSVTLILGPIYETQDLVHLINGYCKYLVENAKPLSIINMTTTANVDEPTDQVPSYSNRHRVMPDEWNYNEIDQRHNEDLKDMDFLQKPKFNNNEEYSMINGSEASKQVNKQQICNGSVKTNWTSQINTSESLESINEEATRLAVDDPVEPLLVNSPELFDKVDAPELKRKSVVNLSDDLLSESTDDEAVENETHEVKKIENDHVEFDQTNSTNNNVPIVILDDVSKSSNNKAPSHSDQSPPDDSACVKLSHDDDDHLANPTLGNSTKLNGLCNTNDRSPSHLHEDNVDLREGNGDLLGGNEDLREINGDLDLREDNVDLRERNEDLRGGNEDLRERNGDLRERNGDLREDNVDLREGNEDLRERNGDLRERNEDLREENGDLREGNGDLREGNGDLREGNGDLREGNGDLHESPVDLSESSAHNSSDDSTTLELSSLGTFDSINSSPAPSPLTLGGTSSPKEEVSIMTNGLDISHEECGDTTTKDGGVFPSDKNNNEGNHSLIATSDKNHVKDGTHGLIIINDKNNGSEDVSLSKRDLDGTASAGNTPYKVNGHKEVNIAIVDMTEALDSTENVKFDKKTEPVRLRRRKSSGFLPSLVNGHLHPTIYTPECIILDAITSDDVRGNPTGSSYPEQITSRSKACNHVLKIIYSLKTKLSSLIHTNHSVRTSNENLRTRKQLMIDKITVLEQCVKQIRQLATTDEKKIIEAVLRLSRALSQLTESCAMLYNGQYSMKNFTEKFLEILDKHIDVLIMTDAWSSTDVSDMSVELHEDHCDIVCNSLGFLRKIINSL